MKIVALFRLIALLSGSHLALRPAQREPVLSGGARPPLSAVAEHRTRYDRISGSFGR